jgi:hypothetical protein
VIIDINSAARAALNASLIQTQVVGIGYTPNGEQQVRARDFLRSVLAVHADRNSRIGGACFDAIRLRTKMDTFTLKNIRY